MKKYELIKQESGLFRIKALKDFGIVKKGELGGLIQKESNLSQNDDSWIFYDAVVYGNAEVCGNATVYGDAKVCGNAMVCGDAKVCDSILILGTINE